MSISVCAGRAALAACLTLVLAACGSETPVVSEGTGSDTAPRADGFVNSLSVAVSGDETPEPVPPVSALSMVGGCDGKSVASIGFFAGDLASGNWYQVSFDTAEPVGKGQTGNFALSSLEWDNGLSPAKGVPETANIKVPNRFEGTGQMQLTTHDTGMDTRRMAGTLSGHLTNPSNGREVDVTIDIDFNWSCGVDLT